MNFDRYLRRIIERLIVSVLFLAIFLIAVGVWKVVKFIAGW